MAKHPQKKGQNHLFGSRSHPSHRKSVVARRFSPFSRSWFAFWRVQGIFVQLGFGYSEQLGDSHKGLAVPDPAKGLPVVSGSGQQQHNNAKRPIEKTTRGTEGKPAAATESGAKDGS